jgi:hypothetical protein
MTTEAFVALRSKQLRHFFHIWYGRNWRSIVARRMGRWDAPRFLVARPGKHRVTLAQLVPVEKFAVSVGFEIDYWERCYSEAAPQQAWEIQRPIYARPMRRATKPIDPTQ